MNPMQSRVRHILPYLRVAEFLDRPQRQLIPAERAADLDDLSPAAMQQAVKNKKNNIKAYHSLCFRLIEQVLRKDRWETRVVDASRFEAGAFGAALEAIDSGEAKDLPGGVIFIAHKGDRRLLFCFEDQGKRILKRVANDVSALDREKYRTICVLILPTDESMHAWRCVECADKWKRGLFLSFPELRRRSRQFIPDDTAKVCAEAPVTVGGIREIAGIASIVARIKENIPVGGEAANHYKLRFEAKELRSIIPGQFIMMDTVPLKSRRAPKNKLVSMDEFRKLFADAPKSYLKRPFGIHRTYFKHFGPDYVRHLSPPPLLATMLHTMLPHEFDILYKVLPHGVGTNEMKNLKPGDRVRMIGPLGKRYDLRELRRCGVKEVHLIGGGVGMAPLIFMIPALKFLSFEVKAFVGVESLDMLIHKDELAASYAGDPENVRIYIDDLLAAGVKREDIFISYVKDAKCPCDLPKKNMARGFVTDLYRAYLASRKKKPATAAFSCGPTIMMHKVYGICKEHDISLKVLMEKPMGCGIGVCLSCVCSTKDKNGAEKYSRVCAEGPIFEADDIIWEDELNSKSI